MVRFPSSSPSHSTTVSFLGGVGSVTGANFLVNTGKCKLLLDCGLVQGDRFARTENAAPFAYTPSDIDVLIVTHAHADHIGRIPKLVCAKDLGAQFIRLRRPKT